MVLPIGLKSLCQLPAQIKTRTNPLIPLSPPPSRSAGDRRATSPSGRAQTESGSRGSVPVGGAPWFSAPPHDLPLLIASLFPHHGLQLHGATSSGSPLHPAPPAPISRRAALRHTEPGELRQHGHQRVHREQLRLLARQHVQVQKRARLTGTDWIWQDLHQVGLYQHSSFKSFEAEKHLCFPFSLSTMTVNRISLSFGTFIEVGLWSVNL